MAKKEIETGMTELDDTALENVIGGLLVPILIGDEGQPCEIHCAVCGKAKEVTKGSYRVIMSNGGYYCDECKAKRM